MKPPMGCGRGAGCSGTTFGQRGRKLMGIRAIIAVLTAFVILAFAIASQGYMAGRL